MAFSISANGATQTIYISEGGSGTKYYNINNGANIQISSFPIQITNTNVTPSSNILKVIFTSGLTVDDNSLYFQPMSDGIQFGSTSLSAQGDRVNITISVDSYDGFIYNGASGTNGKNYIYVYNLIIDGGGHTTQVGAGWLGHKYFGKGTTNNDILNCSSLGNINGGGILGDYAENVTLIGCSSTGSLSAVSGGIVGQEVKSVIIQKCWSTGAIAADGAGGIVGSNCYSATIQTCYSQGTISGNNSGGIIGSNPGIDSVTITNCYSRGAIEGANAGGICGSLANDSGTLTVTITNCYSTGNLNNTGANLNGCICGALSPYNTGQVTITISNCYTTGTVVLSKGYIVADKTTINGSNLSNPIYILSNNFSEAGSAGGSAGTWDSTHANTALTGDPTNTIGVGDTWASTSLNTAYELANFGITPYQTQNIDGNALIQTFSQSVEPGNSTIEALNADASGNSFSILQKSGGDSGSYDTITISAQTGKISTTSQTAVGMYVLLVRSTGSYQITTFILNVFVYNTSADSCCVTTIDQRGLDYAQIGDYKTGNRLLIEHQQNPNQRYNGYSEFVKYKMAQGSRKF
jgi:hypothetical protein